MNNSTKIRFIDSSPATEDEFEGNGHKKVSKAIHSLISQNKPTKNIGIDGKWGSGKSSIIKILEKIDSSINCYVFDTWNHQYEITKYSFIVGLIKDLINKDILKNSWQERLKKIEYKEKTTIIKETPIFNGFFIYVLITALLIPVWHSYFTNMNGWYLLVYNFIPISWLAFLLINTCIKLYKTEKGNNYSFSNNLISIISKNIYPIIQKEGDKVIDEEFREKETSIESLRDDIRNISNELNGKKLLIVFDNIDRVNEDNLPRIWSNLHAIFTDESLKKDCPNIYLIVPFDKLHIENALSPYDAHSTNEEYESDFIDKTFDIIFHVPPPVLRGWQCYLKKKLKFCFGELISENDLVLIERIFDIYFSRNDNTHISPRKIIKTINELCTTYLQWGEKISKVSQLLYVLHYEKLTKKDGIEKLRNQSLISQEIQNLLDIDWRLEITSLYYNVDPKKAYTVLLKDIVSNAIQDKHNHLDNFLDFEGIESIIEDYFSRNIHSWFGRSFNLLIIGCLNLHKLSINENYKKRIWKNIIIHNFLRNQNESTIAIHDEELITPFISILNNYVSYDNANLFCNQLISSEINYIISQDKEDFKPTKDFHRYLKTINETNKQLAKSYPNYIYSKAHNIKNPELYITLIGRIKELEYEISLERFNIHKDEDIDCKQFITRKFKNGSGINDYDYFAYNNIFDGSVDSEEDLNSLLNYMRSNNGSHSYEANKCGYQIIKSHFIEKQSPIEKSFFVPQYSILNIKQAFENNDFDYFGDLFWSLVLAYTGQLTEIMFEEEEEDFEEYTENRFIEGEELLISVLETQNDYINFNYILEKCVSGTNTVFFEKLLQHNIKYYSGSGLDKFDFKDLILTYDNYYAILDRYHLTDSFISIIDKSSSNIINEDGSLIIDFDKISYRFWEDNLKLKSSIFSIIFANIKENLFDKYTANDWLTNVLNQSGFYFNLFFLLVKSSIGKASFSSNYKEAIILYIEQNINKIPEIRFEYLEILHHASRRLVLRDKFQQIIKNYDFKVFFNYWGKFHKNNLGYYKTFSNDIIDYLRKNINDNQCYKWITENQKEFIEIYDLSNKERKEEFDVTIDELLQSNQTYATDIAKILDKKM